MSESQPTPSPGPQARVRALQNTRVIPAPGSPATTASLKRHARARASRSPSHRHSRARASPLTAPPQPSHEARARSAIELQRLAHNLQLLAPPPAHLDPAVLRRLVTINNWADARKASGYVLQDRWPEVAAAVFRDVPLVRTVLRVLEEDGVDPENP